MTSEPSVAIISTGSISKASTPRIGSTKTSHFAVGGAEGLEDGLPVMIPTVGLPVVIIVGEAVLTGGALGKGVTNDVGLDVVVPEGIFGTTGLEQS